MMADDRPKARRQQAEPSLQRELLAIIVLYACLSIVPLLLGWGCSGL